MMRFKTILLTMKNCIQPFLEQQGYLQIDGATATELEARGADIDDDLWSAKLLINSPESFGELNYEYLQAGSDMVMTATYQASVPGFLKAGLSSAEAYQLMRLSSEISCAARDRFWNDPGNRAGRLKPLVAASLGPFGAFLADGSEYHGRYDASWAEVREYHQQRLDCLADTSVDLFAFETIPSLAEAELILDLLSGYPHLQACISFSCSDQQHVAHGEPLGEVINRVAECSQVVAAGINCLAPEWVSPLLKSIQSQKLPIMVYPNSGESWVASEHAWQGEVCSGFPVTEWYDHGARLFGGCCRTTVETIRTMRGELENHVNNAGGHE